MLRTKEITTYQFSELSEDAKEKAREWYREVSAHDDWWEFVYEDFTTIAGLLGISLTTKSVKLMNGKTRLEPAIYFDLGRGRNVDYSGMWSWPKDPITAIAGHAPQDDVLMDVATRLNTARTKFIMRFGEAEGSLSATIAKAKVDEFDTGDMDYDEVPQELLDEVEEAIDDLGPWLLRQLEQEWEYRNSDVCVDENIEANEYEFDEDGDRI